MARNSAAVKNTHTKEERSAEEEEASEKERGCLGGQRKMVQTSVYYYYT